MSRIFCPAKSYSNTTKVQYVPTNRIQDIGALSVFIVIVFGDDVTIAWEVGKGGCMLVQHEVKLPRSQHTASVLFAHGASYKTSEFLKKQSPRTMQPHYVHCLFALSLAICFVRGFERRIVYNSSFSASDKFAAKEARRYLYTMVGSLPDLVDLGDNNADFASLKDMGRTADETIFIADPTSALMKGRSFSYPGPFSLQKCEGNIILVLGRSGNDRLYGVYSLMERLGIRFELHNDVLPDPSRRLPNDQPLPASATDPQLRISDPLFAYRGLQPFHDFPEGPDWWDLQMYKHVITQIGKMKMNFIGLHTYPYNNKSVGNVTGTNEPTTWVGTTDQLNDDGTVKASYPTSYANTLRSEWGYTPLETSKYSWGTSQIFEADCWASFPTTADSCPFPKTEEASNAFFERVSNMLEQSFKFGKQFGVESCLGTETPLSKPLQAGKQLSSLDYYKGIFTRLMKRIPSLSWYWIWTPEGWEWTKVKSDDPVFTDAVKDLAAAMEARKEVSFPAKMATNGWVVGPLPNRTIFDQVLPREWDAITSIDMNTGHDPVDPSYQEIKRHPKWVIPWMEDDPTLTQPQLWVNRTLEHMDSAHHYGCTGLLGIHWRTRATSPQISAMAQKSWNASLRSFDFWNDWVYAHFGASPNTGDIARIFEQIDSFKMPILVNWINGPGRMQATCVNATNMSFVEDLKRFEAGILGDVYRNRFQYWLSTFEYMYALGKSQCAWKRMLAVEDIIEKGTTFEERVRLAKTIGIPARINLVQNVTDMMTFLQRTISTPGELGTYMNLESGSLVNVLNASLLVKYLGERIPREAFPPRNFVSKKTILIVPTARSTGETGETLAWRALVLSSSACPSVSFFYRLIGRTEMPFSFVPMKKVDRSVYTITSNALGEGISSGAEDFEYYIKAECSDHEDAVFPAGAPAASQTMVWL